MPAYSEAPELKDLAEEIIATRKPELRKVYIGYVFREKAVASKGRIIFGMCVRVDDRNHVFSGKDVIIEIGMDKWIRLPLELKKMVMHHELCHIHPVLDPDGEIEIKDDGRRNVGTHPHDYEEFYEVAEAYPEGRSQLKVLIKQWEQEEQAEKDRKAAEAKK